MENFPYPYQRFKQDYEDAIKVSGVAKKSEVERLIETLQINIDAVPTSSNLWPIHCFIRTRLRKQDIPLEWLKGEILNHLQANDSVDIKTDLSMYEVFERLQNLEAMSFELPDSAPFQLHKNNKLIPYLLYLKKVEELKKDDNGFPLQDIEWIHIEFLGTIKIYNSKFILYKFGVVIMTKGNNFITSEMTLKSAEINNVN